MQLRTEIEIEAPPDRVWAVLTDFSSYHEWNPFIGGVSGDLREGARLRLEVSPSSDRRMTLKAHVTTVKPMEELAWKVSHLPLGLLEGVHFFRLTESDGGTRVVQGEDFSGLMVKRTGNALTAIARAFVGMNQALKKRVLSEDGSRS